MFEAEKKSGFLWELLQINNVCLKSQGSLSFRLWRLKGGQGAVRTVGTGGGGGVVRTVGTGGRGVVRTVGTGWGEGEEL
jgi:hypothetical protein